MPMHCVLRSRAASRFRWSSAAGVNRAASGTRVRPARRKRGSTATRSRGPGGRSGFGGLRDSAGAQEGEDREHPSVVLGRLAHVEREEHLRDVRVDGLSRQTAARRSRRWSGSRRRGEHFALAPGQCDPCIGAGSSASTRPVQVPAILRSFCRDRVPGRVRVPDRLQELPGVSRWRRSRR
jgi:hypothetical protein